VQTQCTIVSHAANVHIRMACPARQAGLQHHAKLSSATIRTHPFRISNDTGFSKLAAPSNAFTKSVEACRARASNSAPTK